MDLSTIIGIALALMPKINEALSDGEVTLGEVIDITREAVNSSGMSEVVIYTKPKLAKGKK